jgi:acyl-CoA thioester hydrolase
MSRSPDRAPTERPPTDRSPPGRRADYRRFETITTRWMDNDVYGHVNNAVYFSFFDTAVSGFEVEAGIVDHAAGETVCVVAEAMCRYHSQVAFPDRLEIGIRVARIGTSSVRYECAVFRAGDEIAAAEGHFVHVFVDRASMRPVPVPARARAAMQALLIGQ